MQEIAVLAENLITQFSIENLQGWDAPIFWTLLMLGSKYIYPLICTS